MLFYFITHKKIKISVIYLFFLQIWVIYASGIFIIIRHPVELAVYFSTYRFLTYFSYVKCYLKQFK